MVCKGKKKAVEENRTRNLSNAVKNTSSRTLKETSLTEAQATRCTQLSNYTAFIQAGWTTGY